MRPSLVRLSLYSLFLLPQLSYAQSTRQVEIIGLAGAAHTDRGSRLNAEDWLEPYAGLRVDARLWSLAGGRAGLALTYDYYDFSVQGRYFPPCTGFCINGAAAVPGADGKVVYRQQGADERLALGGTWQRPIFPWLRVDVGGLVGLRRTPGERQIDGQRYEDSAPRRAFLAGEAGVSTQWRAVVTGVGFQYGGGKTVGSYNSGDIRRVQNRVAFRVGYALPIGQAGR